VNEPRRRDTPRRTLRRWDLERGYVSYAFLWFGSLFMGPLYLVRAVLGVGPTSRTVAWVTAAVSLAVAAFTTWLAVLYLRRPVLDPPRPETRVPPDLAARAETDGARDRHRRRPTF